MYLFSGVHDGVCIDICAHKINVCACVCVCGAGGGGRARRDTLVYVRYDRVNILFVTLFCFLLEY